MLWSPPALRGLAGGPRWGWESPEGLGKSDPSEDGGFGFLQQSFLL